MYFIPQSQRMEKQKLETEMKEQLESLVYKKKEAQEAIQIMASIVEKRQDSEREKHGLVIECAVYGKLPHINPSEKRAGAYINGSDDEVVDVTVPIAHQVQKSQLYIPPGTKVSLLGFHDPCFGTAKELCVWYTFHDKRHFVRIKDEGMLIAPLMEHVLAD
jgi:DnaJ family protein C protein 11